MEIKDFIDLMQGQGDAFVTALRIAWFPILTICALIYAWAWRLKGSRDRGKIEGLEEQLNLREQQLNARDETIRLAEEQLGIAKAKSQEVDSLAERVKALVDRVETLVEQNAHPDTVHATASWMKDATMELCTANTVLRTAISSTHAYLNPGEEKLS
jgi:hypothetical protein